jgi:Ecdysteroid kinase-like family
VSATERRELRIVQTVHDLDARWLQAALGSGAIDSLTTEQIGTGQMSESHRVSVTYADPEHAGPATVVLKIASADPSSRSTGIGLGIYEREVLFYREIAPRIGGPLAACHTAACDAAEGWFTLLLEDAAPAEVGDQIAGCSVERARLAMLELARLQAPVVEDQELAGSAWLNRESPVTQALVEQLLIGFLERYGERIAPEHRALCQRFVGHIDSWLAQRRPPLGLVHGDFRLDNLLFGAPGSSRPLTVVDWQTVSWGGAMADASYFLGGSLPCQTRRSCERELFEEYHEALRSLGVRGFSAEHCWTEYRRHAFGGVLMVIVASMIVERTARGDDMFMAMLERASQQALDLESEQLLGDGSAVREPLRPAAADEQPHAPGSEPLWNESWYFDAVRPDGGLGAWVRLGLYPNMTLSWFTALVCGPGRPTVAAVDFAAPLPQDGTLRIATGELRAEHVCRAALERFAVTLEASAQAHEDPADLLRGEPGEPVPVALELEWSTSGAPYAYRLATRYEIPCRVSGQIRIGDETLALAAAHGQRDHSWGLRDWWAMDWMWSALHLDDGTRIHAVQVRPPGAPTLSVGYVQAPEQALIELTRVHAREEVARDGLITRAQLALEPSGLQLEIEPLAFAPLALRSPDGRLSHFPRAMCRARAEDGRGGLGWMEWNLNQR